MCLTFHDLAQVGGREPDAVSVQMKGHLPAVGAGTQGAFGHLGQPEAS